MLTLTLRPPILTCLQNETPPIYAGPRPFLLRQPAEWGSSVRSAVDAPQCSNTSVVMVTAITKTRFQVISPDIGHDDTASRCYDPSEGRRVTTPSCLQTVGNDYSNRRA
jgi:hypothetical protein